MHHVNVDFLRIFEVFLCLDILFLTYSDESANLEVKKIAEIVSNILIFPLFRGFRYNLFVH